MSNHSGSYLINHILQRLHSYDVFETLGKEKTLEFLNEIKELGQEFDCNNGEILENIGKTLKVCYECYTYSDNLKYGVCEKCRQD